MSQRFHPDLLFELTTNQIGFSGSAFRSNTSANGPAAWVTAVSSPSSKASPEIKDLTAKILLKLCHNLVTWDHQSNVIRFAHLSVREFIEKAQSTSAATSNLMAANCCLAFLATPEHWLGHPSVPDFLPAAGFHAYVVRNLMFHIRNCYEYGVGQQLSDLPHFLESLAYSEWIKIAEDRIYDQDIYQGEELEEVLKHLRSQPLNILLAWSYLGNEEEFNRLYDPGVPDILYRNEIGESLLFVACMEGHESIVKTLLNNNVNVNGGGNSDMSGPLQATIQQGNNIIFQMLLDHGAMLEAGEGHNRSVLAEVVETGTTQMSMVVLQKYHHEISGTIIEAAARDRKHEIEIFCGTQGRFHPQTAQSRQQRVTKLAYWSFSLPNTPIPNHRGNAARGADISLYPTNL